MLNLTLPAGHHIVGGYASGGIRHSFCIGLGA